MSDIHILPTGNEIKNGIVLDLDSPEIMLNLLKVFPGATITRHSPLVDDEKIIIEKIREILKGKPDLVILVGGSGGGHRYSPTLSKDFTQSALEKELPRKVVREIYGKNGHLWCKLVCGQKDGSLVINIPGPFIEASAAIKSFVECLWQDAGLAEINHAMAQAVYAQYPQNEVNSL